MKAKKFVAVVGDRNSGKSTIIQALTGCRTNAPKRMIDLVTKKWIYVIPASPQETGMRRATLAGVLRKIANSPNCLGLVIALQPTHPTTRLSIEDILREADNCNAIREYHLFAIYRPYNEGGRRVDADEIKERFRDAVPSVRPHLGLLDGRRFAYMNATIISDNIGWF
jgi:energy-coupling factor transporter ATP-binding protein EcfA2